MVLQTNRYEFANILAISQANISRLSKLSQIFTWHWHELQCKSFSRNCKQSSPLERSLKFQMGSSILTWSYFFFFFFEKCIPSSFCSESRLIQEVKNAFSWKVTNKPLVSSFSCPKKKEDYLMMWTCFILVLNREGCRTTKTPVQYCLLLELVSGRVMQYSDS